jgi:hypothetical protein
MTTQSREKSTCPEFRKSLVQISDRPDIVTGIIAAEYKVNTQK